MDPNIKTPAFFNNNVRRNPRIKTVVRRQSPPPPAEHAHDDVASTPVSAAKK
jgi:hypothetical protein